MGAQCQNIKPEVIPDVLFMDCNGEPRSDESLEELLRYYEKLEQYETCILIREELKRRNRNE